MNGRTLTILSPLLKLNNTQCYPLIDKVREGLRYLRPKSMKLICLGQQSAKVSLKGLCHPRRMRALMRSSLKSLAEFFSNTVGESRKLFSSV